MQLSSHGHPSPRSEVSSYGVTAEPMEIASCQAILGDDEVHVWRASLDSNTTSLAAPAGILSEEELQRAARFLNALDCQHFIRARVILRSLLGFYLDMAPASIIFTRGRFGKLALRPSDINGSVYFNFSYSHGRALYAISRNFEVGVDVEFVQPRLESLHLAEQYLLPEDTSRLRKLLPQQRAIEFFQAWTRMEARQKASGKGLHPSAGESAETYEPATCFDQNLPVWDGFAAALAVCGHGYKVRYMDWPD